MGFEKANNVSISKYFFYQSKTYSNLFLFLSSVSSSSVFFTFRNLELNFLERLIKILTMLIWILFDSFNSFQSACSNTFFPSLQQLRIFIETGHHCSRDWIESGIRESGKIKCILPIFHLQLPCVYFLQSLCYKISVCIVQYFPMYWGKAWISQIEIPTGVVGCLWTDSRFEMWKFSSSVNIHWRSEAQKEQHLEHWEAKVLEVGGVGAGWERIYIEWIGEKRRWRRRKETRKK